VIIVILYRYIAKGINGQQSILVDVSKD